MNGNKVLEMKNIYKNYGGIEALINVDFSVEEGEIHALCGENGAGKSTLIKILTGAEIPDEGQVFINGEEVHFSHPTNAQGHNIGVIYQEFALVPDLSIAENVFLGHRLSNGVNGLVPWEKLRSEAEKVLERLGIKNIDVEQKVSDVSVAYQQLVEIAKAITRNVKILILDEPTSALPPSEVDKLFEVMEALKREGVVMVFISHKLEEVMKICDRVTVLKDGEKMGTREIEETNEKELINLMIGRDLADEYPEKNNEVGDKILEVNNLSGENKYPKEASLYVREGEIIGLSGLVGCGRTELVRCLFGADHKDSGEIIVDGKKIEIMSPVEAVKSNFGLIPESRKEQGIILNMKVRENITMASREKVTTKSLINFAKEEKISKKLVEELNIKTPDIDTPVRSLSGGNQQKVVLAKWFSTDADIIIFDEPTRGIDVGAKFEIYELIVEMANRGKGVIFVSSEMEEIIGLCNRVYVLKEGKISGMLAEKDINEENILNLAI